jgi:pimeloyl-ACP methyl ester carboxylesterase
MLDFQAHLIFPTHAVPRAGPLPPGGEELVLKVEPGVTLAGIYLPADKSGRGKRDLVLAFAGNAWNAQDAAEYLREVFPAMDVVAFHYRGYPPSQGAPSADALIADAPKIYDFVAERWSPRRIIAIGFSIGTGIAAHLAAKRPLDGLILVTPFDSLKAVAQALYPWAPIGPFFSHEIDAATPLRNCAIPVAILAAERDELIAAPRTDALRAAVGNLVFDRTIGRAGHNDIYARSEFQLAMRDAMDALDG